MKLSKKCKEAGLRSLAELSEITSVSVQTLNNWSKDKPALFDIVLTGAVVKKGENNVERIEKFFDELRVECTDSEIAAGLGNGDIDVPEWMAIIEDTDHLKAWDQENGGSVQMGFVTISYSDD